MRPYPIVSTQRDGLARPKLHSWFFGPQLVRVDCATGVVRRVHDVVPPEQRIVFAATALRPIRQLQGSTHRPARADG